MKKDLIKGNLFIWSLLLAILTSNCTCSNLLSVEPNNRLWHLDDTGNYLLEGSEMNATMVVFLTGITSDSLYGFISDSKTREGLESVEIYSCTYSTKDKLQLNTRISKSDSLGYFNIELKQSGGPIAFLTTGYNPRIIEVSK